MFIGRTAELNTLQDIYNKNNFELGIMHGRRRVGSC